MPSDGFFPPLAFKSFWCISNKTQYNTLVVTGLVPSSVHLLHLYYRPLTQSGAKKKTLMLP